MTDPHRAWDYPWASEGSGCQTAEKLLFAASKVWEINVSEAPYCHPTACVDEGASIGLGTKVWHYAHIRSTAALGTECSIGQNVYVDADVVIGNNVKIQNNVSVYSGVTIEDDVFVGPSVVFTNDRFPRAVGAWSITPTLISRGASIGANATIVCGIVLGSWCMVAAGAVVTKSIAPHELVGGNPARRMGWICRCAATVVRTTGERPDVLCAKCEDGEG